MARRGGLSPSDFFKLSLMNLSAALLAACNLPLRAPEPTPASALTPIVTEDLIAPLPTLTPRPTVPPTATPFACVRLLTPANEATLPAAGRLVFSWEPIPDAAAYWLEITLPTGQTVTFDSGGENSRALYLEAFKTEGVYYWKVSALGHGGGLLCTTQPFTFKKKP